MNVRGAAFALVLLITAACAANGRPQPRVAGSGSNPGSSLPRETGAAPDRQWKRFESPDLSLSFHFPTPPGETRYEFPESHSESGTSFAFWVERFDLPDQASPWSYAFAGGASRDLVAPRMRWITDNVKWERRDGTYRVLIGTGSYRVEPIRVITRRDGLQALVFDPNPSFWQDQTINPAKTDRAAILNFAAGYHPTLAAITFYFYDSTSLADIEQVIHSVQFERG